MGGVLSLGQAQGQFLRVNFEKAEDSLGLCKGSVVLAGSQEYDQGSCRGFGAERPEYFPESVTVSSCIAITDEALVVEVNMHLSSSHPYAMRPLSLSCQPLRLMLHGGS